MSGTVIQAQTSREANASVLSISFYQSAQRILNVVGNLRHLHSRSNHSPGVAAHLSVHLSSTSDALIRRLWVLVGQLFQVTLFFRRRSPCIASETISRDP